MKSRIILDYKRHLKWQEARNKVKEIQKVLDNISEKLGQDIEDQGYDDQDSVTDTDRIDNPD